MLIKTHTIVGEEYPVRRVVRDNLLFKQLEELVTQYPSVLLAKRKIDVMNCK
jgi:asparagine synthetase A